LKAAKSDAQSANFGFGRETAVARFFGADWRCRVSALVLTPVPGSLDAIMDDQPHYYANRFRILREGLDLALARIVEIGPLDNPIVLKSEADITYVDVADKETLMRQLGYGIADPSRVVAPDVIWGEQTLSQCLGGARFDCVIASHVAEHVPDLVAWLGEVHDILQPAGELRLAMPDCRFSFDILRRETSLSDVLTNYVLRARRPTVANVLDFRLHFAPDMDGLGRFEGRSSPASVRPIHSFQLALDSAAWARDLPERYFDVHCWVFQPRSFCAIMANLAEHGLVRFACTRMLDPSMPMLEFYAFLSPCGDAGEAAASWRAAAARAADPLPGSAEANAPSKLAALEAELEAARAALAATRNSTSWRLTAPLRRIAEAARGRKSTV
jgi:SAM-dependent methyltransferase